MGIVAGASWPCLGGRRQVRVVQALFGDCCPERCYPKPTDGAGRESQWADAGCPADARDMS